MKKAILLLSIVALAISSSGCKKKTKKITKTKIERLDEVEVAGYRNPAMTKELM